jgi:hypothetical protein
MNRPKSCIPLPSLRRVISFRKKSSSLLKVLSINGASTRRGTLNEINKRKSSWLVRFVSISPFAGENLVENFLVVSSRGHLNGIRPNDGFLAVTTGLS